MVLLGKILKCVVVLFVIVFIVGLGELLSVYFVDVVGVPKLKDSNIQEAISEAADAVNKKSPMMVDNATRLEGAIAKPNALTYKYKIVSLYRSDLDMDTVNGEFAESVRNRACATSELDVFFDNGVSISYAYKDKSGAVIADIVVTGEDCDIVNR